MYVYVAIGDSLVTGVGSTNGFVVPYRNMASRRLGQPIQLIKLARNGLTCEQISSLTFRHSKKIERANIITITAGGNNFLTALRQTSRTGSVDHLPKIAAGVYACLHHLIRQITYVKQHDRKPYIVRVFTLYNPLSKIPVIQSHLFRFNQRLYTLERYPHVRIVDISFLSDGVHYLAKDGIHPNNRGYERIAEAVYQTGFYPL
ncbi:GDSL-type esterase/lipase family protein [Shouchella tritolerans]|uniref:GDSL-type esterase/lipase family protein n=1 Tax=Shouchella tritolerans TaxID=2979466 RepID=UPI00078885AE|nr:GDSL-type esterase/lipase family protein [Shouchella tritolerans]